MWQRARKFHDHEDEGGPVFDPVKYRSHGEQLRGEISVSGNKYVVGVRNMLSPADFGPKLLEVIKAHFPQDVK